jgi:hypothetical protein
MKASPDPGGRRNSARAPQVKPDDAQEHQRDDKDQGLHYPNLSRGWAGQYPPGKPLLDKNE